MLDEPFYQLVRQQLLAQGLESDPRMPYDAVRVLHVLDPANAAYHASIVNPPMKEYGDTVSEIWQFLLMQPERFVSVDPAIFLNPDVTSTEYVARYA